MQIVKIKETLYMAFPLSDMEATDIMEAIEEHTVDDDDQFKNMDAERTRLKMKIEELEEKIADYEEEPTCK